MKALGMFRFNSLELVDIEIRDGVVFPKHCPGHRNIACNDCDLALCTNAELEDDNAPPAGYRKKKRVPFMICYWHERNGRSSGSEAP